MDPLGLTHGSPNRAQRRAAEAITRTNPLAGRIFSVTKTAAAIVIDRLVTEFGNELSEEHRLGLMAVVGGMVLQTFGKRPGRYAYALPAGCGKTQSVVALAAALYREGQLRGEPWLGRSLLIAASSVEALGCIKRDMLKLGIPTEEIGLLHDKAYDPAKVSADYVVSDPKRYASEPRTEGNDQRRILLATHSRLKNATKDDTRLQVINVYRDQPRSLVIWDEVLLSTRAWAASTVSVRIAIAALKEAAEVGAISPALTTALRFLSEANVELLREQERQSEGKPPALVSLPSLPGAEEEDAAEALEEEGRKIGGAADLVRMQGREVRVVPISEDGTGKGAVARYVVTVPDCLTNIAILDASHEASELVRQDATIKADPYLSTHVVKLYGNVTVNFMRGVSGRGSVSEEFAKPLSADALLPREYVELIKRLPADDPILVFTFVARPKGVDIVAKLRARLKAAGVDPDAKTPSGHPRLTFVTWGSHTSANAWSYARQVITVGVTQRGDEDLLASSVGQARDMLIDRRNLVSLADVKRGEVASALYQAMSRGCCRFTDRGQARAMTVWLMHHDEAVREPLEKLMPGLRWERWVSAFADDTPGQIDTALKRILDALATVPATESKISSRKLKALGGLKSIPSSTFSAAVARMAADEWRLEGRSFVRVSDAARTPQ